VRLRQNPGGSRGIRLIARRAWPSITDVTDPSRQRGRAAGNHEVGPISPEKWAGNSPASAELHEGSGLLVPGEDSQRSQRIPPARPAVVFERKVHLARMRILQ
jgi:hypothetical protein